MKPEPLFPSQLCLFMSNYYKRGTQIKGLAGHPYTTNSAQTAEMLNPQDLWSWDKDLQSDIYTHMRVQTVYNHSWTHSDVYHPQADYSCVGVKWMGTQQWFLEWVTCADISGVQSETRVALQGLFEFSVAAVLEGCGQVHNATEDESSVSVKVSFIRCQKNVHQDEEQNKIVYFETQTWECIKQHSLKIPTKHLIKCYLFRHVAYFLLKTDSGEWHGIYFINQWQCNKIQNVFTGQITKCRMSQHFESRGSLNSKVRTTQLFLAIVGPDTGSEKIQYWRVSPSCVLKVDPCNAVVPS